MAVWEADPVTRVYGTTGDYRWVNAPASEQPVYDPLINPGDDPGALLIPEETPTPTEAPQPTEEEGPQVETGTPLELFVKHNPVISAVIGGFMLLIMILNIVLWVRINRLKHAPARRAKRIQTKK